ncbi:MAG: glycosyltransferase family 9 protein [Candidatus Goldbacteria bacterium]|nr:glycosyltransferase family 9 protein [Candidatus Goldiibacteriota bacterium]
MFGYVFKNKWKSMFILVIDVLGTIFFYPVKIFKKTEKSEIKKILVIRLDQMGDVIQTFPFFEALKNKYPSSEIYALVAKETAVLLKNNKNVNKTYVMENSWFYQGKKIKAGETLNLIKNLKKEKIDVAFDLRGDFRNIVFSFLCGAQRIYGYGCTGGSFLLTDKKKYVRDMHEIDKNLNLISEKAGDILTMDFMTDVENSIEIEKFLADKNVSSFTKKVVIHPFVGTQSKLWGFHNFSSLMKKIARNSKNVKFFVIGSHQERKYENEFEWNDYTINCIGIFSLPSTVELIKKCEIYVGCDSGPQYFAAYSGKKTCIIYGDVSNYLRWKPKVQEENFIAVSTPVDCGNCELETCPPKKGHKCMNVITPDEVYEKIKNWFA